MAHSMDQTQQQLELTILEMQIWQMEVIWQIYIGWTDNWIE